MIDILHHSCLSISYSSISNILNSLAGHSIGKAQEAASGPHGLTYDNINLSTSIYVEQGPNTMSKVQSGTMGVIYELLNARSKDMQLQPMLDRFVKSSPLKMSDLHPSILAMRSYRDQTAVNVSQILMRYVNGFEQQHTAEILQHRKRRPLPEGHKTIFHPLRASTIEEASVEGNLLVHDDIYTVQLKKSTKDLNVKAIPTFNDQLTNTRIRGAQQLRAKDISCWERREVFQLGFGTFHLVMNFIWGILETHRGTMNQMGSLTFLFAVLEKTRLGSEHLDYHTLLATLLQILDGLVLNMWRMECGHSSLKSYAESCPTADMIFESAQRIVDKYATPLPRWEPIDSKSPLKDLDGSKLSLSDDEEDIVYENTILLTRDLLYIAELVHAVSTGDFGRVEDILPTIACMFKGSGSNNYSMEILHFLFNIKEVWTPEFA